MAAPNFITCFWCDGTFNPKEAADFYISIFPNSQINHVQHYTSAASEVHGHAPGDVMTVSFTLNSRSFVILNGGLHPNAKHNDAVSFIIECDDQAEIDHYYDKLGEGGAEERKNCGWVADKFGIAWQVVPKILFEYMKDKDTAKVMRVTNAMMGMKKLIVEDFRKAYEGEA
ncbi:3-demethylubiquinone-9 3-methyltransferase [Phaeosphaeriaceae sp. PMI808]|nr:3-demethylubiquinone-9 3-methyltransferase [Phaeosphaeriaceae sp. PMI808]